MKSRVFAAASAALLLPAFDAHSTLLITGVFDGPLPGGEPKVVELVATTAIADLSQYAIGAANNGGGTDGPETFLSGSVSAGDFIYIVEDDGQGSLGEGFNTYFGFTPTSIFDGSFANGGGSSVNGDDAVELFFDSSGAFAGGESVIDTFGDINVDGSGQPWEYLDGWAYRSNGTGPDGTTFVIGNWTFSGINVNDGQTSNATAPTPFPVGSFVIPEPSSSLLGLLGGLLFLRRKRK